VQPVCIDVLQCIQQCMHNRLAYRQRNPPRWHWQYQRHNITCYAESSCGQENRCGQESRCGEASTPMRYELSSIGSTWGQPGGSKRIAAPRLTVVIFLVLFILLTMAPSQTSPSLLACTVQSAHNSSMLNVLLSSSGLNCWVSGRGCLPQACTVTAEMSANLHLHSRLGNCCLLSGPG